MTLWSRYRRPCIGVILFLLSLIVFFAFWKKDGSNATEKSRALYLNDNSETQTLLLHDGEQVSQLLKTEHPIYAVGMKPFFSGAAPNGTVTLEVYSSNEELLASVQKNTQEAVPEQYMVFALPEKLQQANEAYRFMFKFEFESDESGLSLMKSENSKDNWALKENENAATGSLCLLIAVDKIGAFIELFYCVFALLASIMISGLYLLLAYKALPLHKLYMLASVCLGLLYCIILPPYSAPDEQFHINQTFNMSSKLLGQATEDINWNQNVRREGDENEILQDQKTTVFSYREMGKGVFSLTQNPAPAVFEGEGVSAYGVLYYPMVLAVSLGRILHLGFVPVLLLGRLANLLCYVLLTGFAIKYTPVAKGAFAVTALLPMCTHLAASFSRDVLLIALYTFFTAYCLRLLLEDRPIGIKQLLVLAVVALVAGPGKFVYFPIVLLCFLLPYKRFKLGKSQPKKSTALLCKLGILFVGSISFFVQAINMFVASLAQNATNAGPAAVRLASFVQSAANVPNPDGIRFDILYILGHIGQTIELVMKTFLEESTYYLQTLVGGNLSYFTIELDWFFVIALLLLLFVAAIPSDKEPRLQKKNMWIGYLIAAASASLVVLGCIMWTPTYYTTIYGIQGRYFLPMLPLVLCCLHAGMPVLRKSRNIDGELIFASSAVGVFASLNAFLVILAQ